MFTVDFDTAFDALCYSGAGGWARFKATSSAVRDEPWFAAETARSLSSLGHVDFVLDASLQPISWRVAPPVLVMNPKGQTAFLAGFRSKELIEVLARVVKELDGAVDIDTRPHSQPARVLVSGLTGEDLLLVCATVTDESGVPLTASANPARELATALPGLQTLENALPAMPLPVTPAQRFDFAANKWEPVPSIDAGDAVYWVPGHPTWTGMTAGDQIRRAPSNVGKFVSAARQGFAVLAYDNRRQELIVPRGARLPGLFERVAVLCSGELPVEMDDRTLRYQSIPRDVVSLLWERLGPSQYGGGPVTVANPQKVYAALREAYLRYYETAFRLADPDLSAERRALLERDGVIFTEPPPRASAAL